VGEQHKNNAIRIVLAVALVVLAIVLFIRAPVYYETVVREEGGHELSYRALQWGPWFALALAAGILVRQTQWAVALIVIAAIVFLFLWPQVY
jgi:hypothetical protein